VLSMVKQHQGKPLSFNNLLDLDAARSLASEFEIPACVIIKHNNPCGAAVGRTALEAYERAFACDPMSAFGGIIALNRPVDRAAAEKVAGQFFEAIIAPGYDDDALEVFTAKPNARVLEDNERRVLSANEPAVRQVMGGLLVQDRDLVGADPREEMEVVSRRKPDEREWSEMLFAWRVAKHVRSNAIVLTKDLATVGIGAGQMSRVDSVRLAVEKAQSSLEGSAMASDAFFPFPDAAEVGMEAGVTAIIQPGGSKNDADVIAAADRAGVAMVLTHKRHFRH
jgi:phosphoribosylaminoimidazolecarboxamide formyltransferase/IMP cyclohydrolase